MRRSWPVIPGVLLLAMTFASPVPASASGGTPTPAASAPTAHGASGVAKGRVQHVTRTATPQALTPAQKRLQELAAQHRTRSPYSAASTSGSRMVKSVPTAGAARPSTKTNGPKAPNDFNFFRATDMTPYTSSGDSGINEPSVSNMGYNVLYTGNWYSALSTDSGHSFTFINPYTMLPGFCCDQVTISDYSRGQTFWLLQGCQATNCNSGNNVDRIAWANQTNEAANSWFTVDFSAQTFGFPNGDWLDYPHFALGANSLYWSTNIFDSTDRFVNTVMTRFDLTPFTTGGVAWSAMWMSPAQDFTWTATDTRGGTTEYWASVGNCGLFCNQFIRVYNWPEGTDFHGVGSNTFTSCCFGAPLNGFTYMSRDGTCPAPDARNWCARDDSRVKTGWQTGNTVGFQWDARQDSTFPYPYIDQATFDVSSGTPTFVANGQIWNSYAWSYPGAGIDARGHFGESAAIGGGTWGYPGSQFLIQDDINTSLAAVYLDNGVHGAGGWGDFLNARPATYPGGLGNTWVVSGFTMYDNGFGSAYTRPVFYWVGRQRDDPFAPINGSGYANVFSEGSPMSVNTGQFYGGSNCACDYSATNFWGDGGSTGAGISPYPGFPGWWITSGTWTYAEEGTYFPFISVTDFWNGATSYSGTSSVNDAALTPTGTTITRVEGATFSGVVATFKDANTGSAASEFKATINWGDGSSSAGTISGSAGSYTVNGSHKYAEEGTKAVSVAIKDVGGSTATVASTAKIRDAALTSTGTTINRTHGVTFTAIVAKFKDADPAGTATDYTATIAWGDGTTSPGKIFAITGGFSVTGTHKYAAAGTFTVKTTIKDHGASTVATSTAKML